MVWVALNHIDPERDFHFDLLVDEEKGLRRSRRHPRRIGVDATTKSSIDGFERGWPLEMRYGEELCASILARWGSMGLPELSPNEIDRLKRR